MGYTATMAGQSFWFQESKTTANYMLEGLTKDEIYEIVINENIYQVDNPDRAGKIFKFIYKRLEGFSENSLEYFLKTDVASAKIFLLISIMSVDQLFFEFMNEVFKDHIILGDYILEKKEVLTFFHKKQFVSEKIAKWNESSINRLTRSYRTMLFESGVYDKKNNKISIPFIDINLVKLLKDEGFGSYIETIEI